MDYHIRFEQDVNPIRMFKELSRACNSPRGGTIDQSYLFLEGAGANGWINLYNQQEYINYFEGISYDWLAELIKDHLDDTKFDKRKVDLIGLTCGCDGKREGLLAQSLLESYTDLHIQCSLIDKSNPFLIAAYHHLTRMFMHENRFSLRGHLADLWKLSSLPNLFDSDESQTTLRVGCMFGGTMNNLDNELRFIRDSLHVFKSGDLFLVDIGLGFARYDNPAAIREEDPGLFQSGAYLSATQKWLSGIFKQHREQPVEIGFKKILHTDTSTSAFPNTYTIENHIICNENSNHPIQFNMLRQHRYHQESFINIFAKTGFKKLGGQTYGPKKNRLVYAFIKE